MAEFTYKPALTANILSQYIKHREALHIIGMFDKSPDRLVAYQTSILQSEMRNATDATISMASQICDTIEDGMEMLSTHLKETNYRLGEISDTLNSMYAMLDYKTDIIINLQRETNALLSDLLRISVIPDRQKDSYSYIEKGINFFNAAIQEGFESDLFKKVITNLNTALELDDDNFITYFYLGQVYLSSKEFLDPAKAEKNFVYSAKLAKILSISSSQSNHTALYNQMQFGHTVSTKDALLFEASSALIGASKAAYLQMNFQNSAAHCQNAMSLTPNWTEPIYRYAKAVAALGNGREAANAMTNAIELDRFQVLKVLQDDDLSSKVEIQELISTITEKSLTELQSLLKQCLTCDRSKTKVVAILEEAATKKSYLETRAAIDELKEEKEWEVFYLREDYSQYGGNNEREKILWKINCGQHWANRFKNTIPKLTGKIELDENYIRQDENFLSDTVYTLKDWYIICFDEPQEVYGNILKYLTEYDKAYKNNEVLINKATDIISQGLNEKNLFGFNKLSGLTRDNALLLLDFTRRLNENI